MDVSTAKKIEDHIREVPDFLENGPAFHSATENIDYARLISAEARGFVFGTALAYRAKKVLA